MNPEGRVSSRAFPVEGEPVERYTMDERINHWLAGLSYVYLMLTGLALFTPHLYWMATLLGGGPTVRFWHPWVGLVFCIAVIWMHKLWRADMRITPGDKVWNREVKKYIENRDEELPPVGRFNPGQKEFYWVMFYAMLLLLISGIVMWTPEYVPWSLRAIRPIAVILHEIAALITIGAFIIHVYMGIFMVPGGFRAIVLGYVSREWAKANHQLWYERIAKRPAPER
jgi:formate dehydrogenase subunit gamma